MPVGAEREARLLSQIQSSMETAVAAGVIRVRITDERLEGTTIRVHGRDLVNFGSCSYLGLGQDDRLKQAAIDAVRRFGPSYSSSATYAAVDLYTELEDLLRQVCHGKPVIPAATTTLMHLAALPVLIRSDDAVVIDVQAHASLRLATDVLRGRGVKIKTVPHNDMKALHRATRRLTSSHQRAWILVDGVYSMFGDIAPLEEIAELMAQNEQVHAYFDDAHGFGWAGECGAGVVLDRIALTDRMYVAISLSKAFGAGGGAIICGDEASAQTILHTGGTLTFGGPIHPAVLGAGIASARILLSPEQRERAKRLTERVDLVNELLDRHSLPTPAKEQTPIFFVEIGTTEQAIRMAKIMMMNGYYVNVSAFPVVPRGHGGVRFTVTAEHDPADIEAFLDTLAHYVQLPDDVDLTELEPELSTTSQD